MNDQFSPASGNIIGADGEVRNIVDLLGGGTPVSQQVYDASQYAPRGSLILGSDGKAYDLVDLLQGAGGADDSDDTSAVQLSGVTVQFTEGEMDGNIINVSMNYDMTVVGVPSPEEPLSFQSAEGLRVAANNKVYLLPFTKPLYSGSIGTNGRETHLKGCMAFDGTEDWQWNSRGPDIHFYLTAQAANVSNYVSSTVAVTTHFQSGMTTVDLRARHGVGSFLMVSHRSITSADEFKAWLAGQAAQGTPLRVLYSHITPVRYVNEKTILRSVTGNNTVNNNKGLEMSVAVERGLQGMHRQLKRLWEIAGE